MTAAGLRTEVSESPNGRLRHSGPSRQPLGGVCRGPGRPALDPHFSMDRRGPRRCRNRRLPLEGSEMNRMRSIHPGETIATRHSGERSRKRFNAKRTTALSFHRAAAFRRDCHRRPCLCRNGGREPNKTRGATPPARRHGRAVLLQRQRPRRARKDDLMSKPIVDGNVWRVSLRNVNAVECQCHGFSTLAQRSRLLSGRRHRRGLGKRRGRRW
jgi:hypothetical protein